MAQTSAETTLGENIHTRTTPAGQESQVAVIGIDGSNDVVPADATDGLSVNVTNASLAATLTELPAGNNNIGNVDIAGPNVQGVSGPTGNSDDENADAVTVRAGLWAHDPSQSNGARLMPLQANASGALLVAGVGDSLTVDGTVAVSGTVPVSLSEPISVDDNGGSLTVDGTVTANLAAGSNNIGDVDVLSLPALPAGNNNIGDVDIASALPVGTNNIGDVDIASFLGSLPAGTNNIGDVDVLTMPTTNVPQVTSVADTASSVQLLASLPARLGAMIFNDSTEALFVKFGTTASATSFTVKLLAGGYFEFPQPIYTGRVDGIWANDSSGNARITELTWTAP